MLASTPMSWFSSSSVVMKSLMSFQNTAPLITDFGPKYHSSERSAWSATIGLRSALPS